MPFWKYFNLNPEDDTLGNIVRNCILLSLINMCFFRSGSSFSFTTCFIPPPATDDGVVSRLIWIFFCFSHHWLCFASALLCVNEYSSNLSPIKPRPAPVLYKERCNTYALRFNRNHKIHRRRSHRCFSFCVLLKIGTWWLEVRVLEFHFALCPRYWDTAGARLGPVGYD